MLKVFMFIISAAITLYALQSERAKKLTNLSDGKIVHVAYVQGNSMIQQPQDGSTQKDQILMGYDTEKDSSYVINGTLSNYTRVLITRDGGHVVYTNAIDTTVHIIDWNGENDRTVAKGTAGSVWYNETSSKEYALYGKNLHLRNKDGKSEIWLVNIFDTLDKKVLLKSEDFLQPSTTPINPSFLSLSKDGNFIAGLSWPNVWSYNIVLKQHGPSNRGCWSSTPYDNSYRLLNFEQTHFYMIILQNGSDQRSLELSTEEADKAWHGKLATYQPNILCLMRSPGIIQICKLNETLDTITDSVTVAEGANKGHPDVWFSNKEVKSVIKLQSPTAGVVWVPDSVEEIQWKSKGKIDSVLIEISIDSSKTWPLKLKQKNSGVATIKVPKDISSSECFIKISSLKNPTVFDLNEHPFIVGVNTHISPRQTAVVKNVHSISNKPGSVLIKSSLITGGAQRISIKDCSGRKISTNYMVSANQVQIDTKRVSAGVYFLEMKSANDHNLVRFMVF